MELRHLRYFVAVAEELSFTRAAAVLHVAQSAVSAQVRLLEDSVGVTLLERSSRRVELTGAGRIFPDGGPGCRSRQDRRAVCGRWFRHLDFR